MAHTPSAKERCRAQALLWLAEGRAADEVAELLRVSRQTVYNWAERFQRREGLDLRARLLDAPRSGRPPTASGVIDPLIAEVIDNDPRELRLPLDRLDRAAADAIPEAGPRDRGLSQERRAWRSNGCGIRWKRPRHQLALRPETWRQSKGG